MKVEDEARRRKEVNANAKTSELSIVTSPIHQTTCCERNTTPPSTACTMAAMQKVAANTLRTAVRPTLSRRIPAIARHESSVPATIPDPPVPMAGIMFRGEGIALTEAMRRDNPDYTVALDYRTSYATTFLRIVP